MIPDDPTCATCGKAEAAHYSFSLHVAGPPIVVCAPGQYARRWRARTPGVTDLDRCRAGLCDSGYPCPMHAMAPRMVEALRACEAGLAVEIGSFFSACVQQGRHLLNRECAYCRTSRLLASVRAILRVLDGPGGGCDRTVLTPAGMRLARGGT